ncbi:hypothetical protein [Flavobacterium sp.]|uniref:hypothetical protein n=1 Tax=Flavobacterium sp. TaxID=239 RepID=UPI003D126E54
MKVTASQLEQLKEFTIKHYVEWVDLQMELVDHLANGIETQWAENPSLTFEECLEKEFKKFGIFGFMDVVENRVFALNKKYNKLILQHFKTFFTLPKILLTCSAIFLVYTLLLNKNIEDPTSGFFFLLYAVGFVGFVSFNVWRRNKNKQKERWLLKDIIFGKSSLMFFFFFPFQVMNTVDDFLEGKVGAFLFAFFLISFLLIIYIMLFEIPAKADKYLTETYPEYKFYQKL